MVTDQVLDVGPARVGVGTSPGIGSTKLFVVLGCIGIADTLPTSSYGTVCRVTY